MYPPRKTTWLAVAGLFLLLPTGSPAKTAVTREGCNVTITINMQFTGAGADQAFADKVKKEVEDCYKGFKADCCPVTVQVTTKVGGAADADFHQITVLDDAGSNVDDNVSSVNTPLPQPNGAAGSGTWSKSEPAQTYAHEAGHLLGLGDTYKEKEVGGQRVTEPCAGHEHDKMATLSGKPQASDVAAVVEKAGITCPEECKAGKAEGTGVDGRGDSEPPPPPPASGARIPVIIDVSPASSWQIRVPESLGGGSAFATGFTGTAVLAIDGPVDPALNPLKDPLVVAVELLALDLTGPPVAVGTVLSTGPNHVVLDRSNKAKSSFGEMILEGWSGQFEVFLFGQIENSLFGPHTVLPFEARAEGILDFVSGVSLFDTEVLILENATIFTEGFESGDVSAWSRVVQ